jgi:hypothetical protein
MNIKTITTLQVLLSVGTLLAVAAVLVQPSTATAQATGTNGQPAQAPVQNRQAAPQPTTTSGATYQYVAQPDDSYAQMARKAVQTYGKKFRVTLSQGQILFAETNMTLQAGSPLLAQGQAVSIKESDVKSWADKARALDAASVSRWNAYLAGVNFNTDRIGETARAVR